VAGPYVEPADDPEGRPRERRRLGVLWRLIALIRPYRVRFVLAVAMLPAC
jgi:hypothetical protein